MSVWWDSGEYLSCCRQASGLVCHCLFLFLVYLPKTLHSRQGSRDSFCPFSHIPLLKGDKAMLLCLCQSTYIKACTVHWLSSFDMYVHFADIACRHTSTSSCSNGLPVRRRHPFLRPPCGMLIVGGQSWWVVLSTTPCSHPICVQ